MALLSLRNGKWFAEDLCRSHSGPGSAPQAAQWGTCGRSKGHARTSVETRVPCPRLSGSQGGPAVRVALETDFQTPRRNALGAPSRRLANPVGHGSPYNGCGGLFDLARAARGCLGKWGMSGPVKIHPHYKWVSRSIKTCPTTVLNTRSDPSYTSRISWSLSSIAPISPPSANTPGIS